MDLSTAVLGRSIVSYLVERQTSAVLQIGSDKYDRASLANVACYHFVAASNLSRLLKDLGVRNTRDLFDNVAPERLVLPRLGAVSLAVLGAAFQAKGIGGSTPLAQWFDQHRTNGKFHSFSSLKNRETEPAPVSRSRSRRSRRSKRG